MDTTQDKGFFDIVPEYKTIYTKLSNGEVVGFRREGSGPPLLMIHGAYQCSI